MLGEIAGHRAGQLTIDADQHVGQALGAALFGPFLPGVQLPARLPRPAGHDDRPHVGRLEHSEGGVDEVTGELGEFEPETQVRLVGAIARHRIEVAQPVDRQLDLMPGQLRPQGGDHFLAHRNHVVLLDEAHLDIELGELGLPVGAEVLVPIAAGDLVVPLHASNHE